MNKPRLVFVYLGRRFPDYAKASIELVELLNDVQTVLIASQSIKHRIMGLGIEFVAIEDFYDSSIFMSMNQASTNSSIFRGGFWLKTLERFFVLEQYMSISSERNILHAELDQLLFRVDMLSRNLVRANFSGMMLPFHLPGIAVASVVFISDANPLSDFIDYSTKQLTFDNEMSLLASWSKRRSSQVYASPTFSSLKNTLDYESKLGVPLVEISKTHGYIDPAQLGQWVGGIDPRNVPLRQFPANKYVDPSQDLLLDKRDLSKCIFNLDTSERFLMVTSGESSPKRLYNLHLHSKIHRLLLSDSLSLKTFFDISNQASPHRFTGTKRTQLVSWVVEMWSTFSANPLRSVLSLFRRIRG